MHDDLLPQIQMVQEIVPQRKVHADFRGDRQGDARGDGRRDGRGDG
jgi:hypothetical protein